MRSISLEFIIGRVVIVLDILRIIGTIIIYILGIKETRTNPI